MAEFIDRQAALEECDWYANEFCECEYAIMPLKGALEILPAADVRPVVRGKWTRIDYEPHGHDYKCSACGWKNDMPTHFCPNCGAEMREES